VGGVTCAVGLNAGRRRGRQDDRDHGGSGPQRIAAPMPGKIVRVPVTEGEAIRARQTVVVIEAMKMENELRAGRDGTVDELHAREGALVEAGELLVVIR
jgi:biotin carboxyl carrier protein